ncbi:MAG TPA: hypothetical protein VFS20_01480 [Longimicrobium sp.]|nr:hypothetical protein [Longimicrobium sp.]
MRGPFRGAAADPAGHVEMESLERGFVVIIARRPPPEDEAPFDLSSIPTFTADDIAAMEEMEKRSEVEQILAQQASVLETLGRRKTVTAATVAFGLGVAATLLFRGRQPESSWN